MGGQHAEAHQRLHMCFAYRKNHDLQATGELPAGAPDLSKETLTSIHQPGDTYRRQQAHPTCLHLHLHLH